MIPCQMSGDWGCSHELRCRNIKISRGSKIVQRGMKEFWEVALCHFLAKTMSVD